MVVIRFLRDWTILDVDNLYNLVAIMMMFHIHAMKSTTTHAV
ncbi:MAG: hypothetical protein OK436_03155 [Thaumarchaeota archaeon]|nr:hypothetical protein [Nitrososphaerota archaeon]